MLQLQTNSRHLCSTSFTPQLIQPKTHHTTFADWTFSCYAPHKWSQLPPQIRNANSITIQGRIQVWANPAPASPFWQLNYANSACFGSISAYFSPISTLGPLFLQILGPALPSSNDFWNLISLNLPMDSTIVVFLFIAPKCLCTNSLV